LGGHRHRGDPAGHHPKRLRIGQHHRRGQPAVGVDGALWTGASSDVLERVDQHGRNSAGAGFAVGVHPRRTRGARAGRTHRRRGAPARRAAHRLSRVHQTGALSTDSGSVVSMAKLLLQLVISIPLGLLAFGLMVFWPAGTFDYWRGWAFIAVFALATLIPSA